MNFKEKLPSRRHSIEIGALLAVSFALLNPLESSLQGLSLNFTPETVKAAVLELGIFAPIGMIFLEWLQVVVAFLPPVTMVASGYTFGMFHGSLYSWIGMTLGSTTAILLGRRYGKPLVEKVVSEEHMEKFNHLTEEHGLLVLTIIFLAPGFPDDVFCYLAGMTEIDLKKLFLSASLGRIPTVITLNLTVNSIALANTKVMAAALGVFIGASVICVKKEQAIINTAARIESSLSSTFGYL